jgi:AcrR family transcriptional regulator
VGGKRDANRRLRTWELQEAAMKLFLTASIAAVTIDEIVQVAGVAKGSFYRYFKDKEDLVDALMAPVASELRAAFAACERTLGATPSELIRSYMGLAAALVRVVAEHPRAVRIYLQESRAPAAGANRPIARLAREISQKAVVLTQAATQHGLLRPLGPKITALAVVGAAERLLFGYLAEKELEDANAVAGALITMVMEGLAPKPPPGT